MPRNNSKRYSWVSLLLKEKKKYEHFVKKKVFSQKTTEQIKINYRNLINWRDILWL